MKIIICSATDAIRFAKKYKQYDIVSIACDADKEHLTRIDKVDINDIYNNCKNVLRLSFSDIGRPNPSVMVDVRKAIEWAKGKDYIIVHCLAGISRSSAIAYVIACSQMPVDHAITVLNLKFHSPNMSVVRLGSEILGNKKMLKTLEREQKRVQKEWMKI